MSESDLETAETRVFEEEREWPYPILPCCPVCRSESLLYFPVSVADTKVYCTRCKWKASIRHAPERRPTLDSLPDVPSMHEQYGDTEPATPLGKRTPRAKMTVDGIGPLLPPADTVELGPAGQTMQPSTNFIEKPDPPWADKPMPGVPHPEIDDDAGPPDEFD